jgi:UDP-N-acetylglucosamine--dolichyl-phosphate N-acetylglucosaminephosphotransferase
MKLQSVFIMIAALSLVAYFTGSPWLMFIGICMIAALLPFYRMNKFPARVFPGDVLTYPLGGLIAIMAILGNFEKIAVFFFIPYICEVFLKLRGKLHVPSFGKPHPDNTLELPHQKIYGLEHLSIAVLKKIKTRVYESDVVHFIYAFQILIIVLGLIIFRESIFI